MSIARRFPSVTHMQYAAQRRLPRFAWDYLSGGIGREAVLEENFTRLDRIKLMPRYLVADADEPRLSRSLLDGEYSMPFGVAPLGLSGIVWPGAAVHLARAAKGNGIPFTLSGFATSSIEQIGAIGGNLWYQHYATVAADIDADMLRRADDNGFSTLIVTVDIPTATRRDRDIRNGLSVPPEFNLRTLVDILLHPAWALAMLRDGVPEFESLKPYLPQRANLAQTGLFLRDLIEGHVSLDKLARYRQLWPGRLIVKGVLDPDEARACVDVGADAIVVSNHGGRQLDAALHAIDAFPAVRAAVGETFPLIADGGIRNGLDIVRYLAHGVEFVLLGRAFTYALGALGAEGPDHVMKVLRAELRATLGQLGCADIEDLADQLISRE